MVHQSLLKAGAGGVYILGTSVGQVGNQLATCGRLEIGLCFLSESFLLDLPLSFVAIFHSRRLPHFHDVGQPIFVTWRLHGSLPLNRRFPEATTSGHAFLTMDRLLAEETTGPLYLRRPEIASMIVEAIRYRDICQYRLHSFAVMPNHVHILITPQVTLSRLMQSLKRFTAREGNRILGLTGHPFWQDESYDRLVRDEREFERIARYIEMNPVNAGLVTEPEQFPWSSAGPIANRPQVANLPH